MEAKQLFITNLNYLKGNLTINELSKIADIPQPTLYRYSVGISDITLTNLVKLAKALNCTINDFVHE